MSNRSILAYYFYKYLIEKFLPFHARYVALTEQKDLKMVKSLIRFYYEEIIREAKIKHIITNEDGFRTHYQSELDAMFKEELERYLSLLCKLYIDTGYTLPKEFNDYKKDERYWEACTLLEGKLGLYNGTKEHNTLNLVKEHTNNEIYSKELSTLKEYLTNYQHAYVILKEQYEKTLSPQLEKIDLQANYEFLNYLSHYSTGIIYFESPRIFITNLRSAINHLKRALMHIYDGLIRYEHIGKTVEYLELRTKKVESLGQNNKLDSLIHDLTTYYKNKSTFYKTYKHKYLGI